MHCSHQSNKKYISDDEWAKQKHGNDVAWLIAFTIIITEPYLFLF